MARISTGGSIGSRSSRTKLAPRREPYWAQILPGRHLGYRRRQGEVGTWIARHRDAATGERSYHALGSADDDPNALAGTLDFAAAQAAAVAWFTRSKPDQKKNFTVNDALDDYVAFISAHKKPKTARDTRYRVDAHVRPALGDLALTDLTTARLKSFLEALAVKPATVGRVPLALDAPRKTRAVEGVDARRGRRASANRVWTILRAALVRAYDAGRVASDDAWRRVKPFRNAEAARVRWLTKVEITRLLGAASPDMQQLIRGALLTGARYGEITRLKVEDFDPHNSVICFLETKSHRPRFVPLDDEGATFFSRMTSGRDRSAHIFLKQDGRAWGASDAQRPIASACIRGDIEPPATFHTLRHTYASLRIMAGAPLSVVATALGHTDTRMVSKHYGHLAPSYVRDVIRATALGIGAGDLSASPDQPTNLDLEQQDAD
ncbi:tyrosine-type recombinase/integrase [Geminicoccus harenae]|uniref:tyrosine-type recombinase/integrase n=1 Tax=Geminicoccus harenae TaxID=2498453 RepID=UPI001CC2A71D